MTGSVKTSHDGPDAASNATFTFPRLELPPVPRFTRTALPRTHAASTPGPIATPRAAVAVTRAPRPAFTPASPIDLTLAPRAVAAPVTPAFTVPTAPPVPSAAASFAPAVAVPMAPPAAASFAPAVAVPTAPAAAAPAPYELPKLLDPWVEPGAETTEEATSGYRKPSKLPQITLMFWMLKMAATTLGETGGDQISESMHAGYVITFALFMAIFLTAVIAQVRAGRLVPALYWTVIVATSAAGTEMADFIFKTIGIGFVSGGMALVFPVALIMLLGRFTGGSFSVTDITSRRDEVLYWATILTTNTIGTGVGDGLTAGLGVVGGTIVASTLMGVIALLYFRTQISRVALFWAAFIMTRPLGATGGDLLWQPQADGGLGFGRVAVSLLLIGVMVTLVFISTRKLEQSRGKAIAFA